MTLAYAILLVYAAICGGSIIWLSYELTGLRERQLKQQAETTVIELEVIRLGNDMRSLQKMLGHQ